MGVSAYILLGGNSTRMGTSKAFVQVQGKMCIQWVFESLTGVADSITLVGNESTPEFPGMELIRDVWPNTGPLGGIATALQHSKTEHNLIAAVDMPFITTEFWQHLLSIADGRTITVPTDGESTFPLTGYYPSTIFERIKERVEAGQLGVLKALDQFGSNRLDITNGPTTFTIKLFANINAPNDLEQWQ